MPSRLAIRLAAVLMAGCLTVCVTLQALPDAHAAERVAAGVVIPDFFDPNRRLDKPEPGALPSIRFATALDFPPFAFTGPDGRPAGFDVDLARAICAELAIACTMQARPFDTLPASIAEGRIDAAIAGIAITASSRERLAFSDVYLRPAARFIGPAAEAGREVTPATLAGRSVAVTAGSAHEAYLQNFFPEAVRLAVDSPQRAAEAVKSGRAAYAFGDGIQLAFWLQSAASGDCCGFVGGPYLEPRFFGQGFAIALPPARPELRQAIDWALDSLYDKGIFAEIYLRYFPVGYF